jgi:hypothetical protein
VKVGKSLVWGYNLFIDNNLQDGCVVMGRNTKGVRTLSDFALLSFSASPAISRNRSLPNFQTTDHSVLWSPSQIVNREGNSNE